MIGASRTRAVVGVVGVLISALAGIGLTAAPAYAAGPSVLVSANGQTYSATYPGQLFGPSAALIPGGAIDRPFWIKNANSAAGYVRVALVGITTADIDYAQALSLTVSSAGWPGTAVPVLDAAPCYTLAQGQVIPGGGTLEMDALAQLGNLNGTDGQRGVVNYSIVVELSGEPITESDTTCPATGLPIAGSGDGSSTTIVSTSVYRYNPITHTYTMGGGTRGVTSTVTPITTTPGTTSGSGVTPFLLDVNTARLYQEWDVALWVLGALLGGIASGIIAIRRRATDNPNTRTNGVLR